MSLRLQIAVERFPIAGRFVIARGAKTEAVVVVATLTDGRHAARGEGVPYARYGETAESVVAALESVRASVEVGIDRFRLQEILPAGSARNALDCALIDLEAKQQATSAARLLGVAAPEPRLTCYTLSLDTPQAMHAAAKAASERPILKIKLGAEAMDLERLAAVRQAAPSATLLVDANEGWTPHFLAPALAACAEHRVALVEQPLPAADDAILAETSRPVPVCADESAHTAADIPRLLGRYDAVNIKLDKAGGLTSALAMAKAADDAGLAVMVGCMVSTSLSMAPAMLLAQTAAYVDLDGPLLLAVDRNPGLHYDGSVVYPPTPELWG